MRAFALLILVHIVYGLGGSNGPLLGGYQPGDVNDPEIKKIANFALDELNKKENSLRSLSRVVSVQTQVVAGVNYNFVLHVKNGDQDEICDLTVYDIPWEQQRTLTKDECHPAGPKKPVLGGEKVVSLDNDQGVKDAVVFATDQYNSKLNSIFRAGPAAVENIKKQTVSGTLYTFTITFMPTNCVNDATSQGKALDECAVNDAGTKTKCTYKISFQAWTKHQYTVKSEECHEVSSNIGMKAEMATKLKNLLGSHTKPSLDELLLPGQMLPGLTAQSKNAARDVYNHISPLLKREVRSVDDLQPIIGDIGKRVLAAYQQGKKEYLNENGKVDLDRVLGKDGHDLVKHQFDKLLGGDSHDFLQHGLDQLLGGDGHDFQKHDLDNLLGGDSHDMIKHGLSQLLGGDDHDMKKHGGLIGGDDHDMKKHGGLIGGDDHDMKKHGGLIGGDDHDMKKHGGLIGGDDHDMKKHGGLIGSDDHDMKKHGGLFGGDGHDLCHMGHFKEFMLRHGKSYESVDEENKRFAVFCNNMALARQLNETEQGTAVYGATKFADLTQDEFREKYLSKKNWADIHNHGAANMWRAKIPKGVAPKSFDWRDHGAVTPVKNQGQCGSCWAFSTTGNIEGQWKIQKGDLVSLSEQELVDCDKLDEGCNGGLPSNAYTAIMKLGGLETESEYKYEGEDEKCMFNKSEVAVKINGAVNISSNEAEMASWLAQNGPISIGINANAMQFYFGGISHPWKIFCNPKNLDHGVLIVGYGIEGSEPYWIVKNSWGPDWGEKGYYRVYRGGGVCGLNTMCTSAVVN